MTESIALVAVQWHRRFLRRFIRLPVGAPDSWTCAGGWHEAVVAIGDFVGTIEAGSAKEKSLTPARIDERWPMQCARCEYQFTNRDRYQLLTRPLPELLDD